LRHACKEKANGRACGTTTGPASCQLDESCNPSRACRHLPGIPPLAATVVEDPLRALPICPLPSTRRSARFIQKSHLADSASLASLICGSALTSPNCDCQRSNPPPRQLTFRMFQGKEIRCTSNLSDFQFGSVFGEDSQFVEPDIIRAWI
jgi:hypothetical protein